DHSNGMNGKILAAVRLDIAASAEVRDQMLGELNAIGSEEEAAKWAHRRLSEKNKLNAADAKHIEEAFRTKLLSFAIHHSEGVPKSQNNSQIPDSNQGSTSKRKPAARPSAVDKSVLVHPEPRRVRDREHLRFVAEQSAWFADVSPAMLIICAS